MVDGIRAVGVTFLSPVGWRIVGVGMGRLLSGQGRQGREGGRWRGLVAPLGQPQVLQLPEDVVEAGVEVVREPNRQGGQVGARVSGLKYQTFKSRQIFTEKTLHHPEY